MVKKIVAPTFYINNWWTYYFDFFNKVKSKKILYKLRNGKKLYALPNTFDSRIINEIWGENVYLLDTFNLNNPKVIIDIGGHKGYFSVYCATKYPSADVFSIEPLKANLDILHENVKVNKLKKVHVYPYGVSDKKEQRKLYAPNKNSGGVSMIKDWFDAEKNLVSYSMKCITLDDLIKKEKIKEIDLLKIDVEGGEYAILKSLSNKTFDKIKNITMEYHQIGSLKVQEIKKILKKQGFTIRTQSNNPSIGMLYAKRTS